MSDSWAELFATDAELSLIAARDGDLPQDAALASLALLAAAVDGPELPALDLPEADRAMSRARKGGWALTATVALLVTSSGVAAAVTNDPLAPLNYVTHQVLRLGPHDNGKLPSWDLDGAMPVATVPPIGGDSVRRPPAESSDESTRGPDPSRAVSTSQPVASAPGGSSYGGPLAGSTGGPTHPSGPLGRTPAVHSPARPGHPSGGSSLGDTGRTHHPRTGGPGLPTGDPVLPDPPYHRGPHQSHGNAGAGSAHVQGQQGGHVNRCAPWTPPVLRPPTSAPSTGEPSGPAVQPRHCLSAVSTPPPTESVPGPAAPGSVTEPTPPVTLPVHTSRGSLR